MVDRTYSFRTSIVVIVAITCGIIGIAVGFLMKLSPDYWPQLIGDIILYSFTAVLTSGVFAAILNSEQYSRVFQRHIFEVFNDPKKLTDIVDVKTRWKSLTQSRLKDVLPDIYKVATDEIDSSYFDNELDYYYENFNLEYEVNIDNDGIASITNTFQADLLINPCKEVNEFSQSIKIENPKYANVVLTYLEVGGKPVANTEGVFNKDDKDAGRFQLKVELPEGNRIRVCRTYQYQDDLKETPYLAITVGRYMKGARLSLKVGGSWEVKFIETGFQPNGPVGTPENRPQGWKTWYLAGQNELILPGKGYIFSFIPTMNKCDKSLMEASLC